MPLSITETTTFDIYITVSMTFFLFESELRWKLFYIINTAGLIDILITRNLFIYTTVYRVNRKDNLHNDL